MSIQDHNSKTNKLVRLAKLGDHQAFEQLIKPLQDKIYRRALQASDHPSDAEDIMQDTLLTAYSKLHTFRQEALFSSWVYQICTYQILMYHRKQQLRKQKESMLTDMMLKEVVFDSEFFMQELLIHLKKVIMQLDHTYQPIMLLWIQGRSIKQIQSITQLSISAIKSRLHRAKKTIKIHLQSLGLLENN